MQHRAGLTLYKSGPLDLKEFLRLQLAAAALLAVVADLKQVDKKSYKISTNLCQPPRGSAPLHVHRPWQCQQANVFASMMQV